MRAVTAAAPPTAAALKAAQPEPQPEPEPEPEGLRLFLPPQYRLLSRGSEQLEAPAHAEAPAQKRRRKEGELGKAVMDTWVECDKCKKWRRNPNSGGDVPGRWWCELNDDPRYDSCDKPQEAWDDESEVDDEAMAVEQPVLVPVPIPGSVSLITPATGDDCGHCVMCLDKPKFGGPGIKRKGCLAKRTSALMRPPAAGLMESAVRARVLQKLHQLYTPPETTTTAATTTAPAPVKAEPREVEVAAVAPVTAAAAKRAKKARAKDEAAPATAAGEKKPRKKAKGEASVKLEGAMDEIAAAVLEGAAEAAPKEEEAAAAPVKEEVVA